MAKRKREEVDTQSIAIKFDSFVEALSALINATPKENFSTKDLSPDVEDRVVIAKVLKRMHNKGKLSWLSAYIKESDETPAHSESPKVENYSASQNIGLLKNIRSAFAGPEVATSDKFPPDLPAINTPNLLKQVFTHRSYANLLAPHMESTVRTHLHNERLEFLGDSFLNHTVTKILYARMGNAREGQLSVLRAQLIENANIAEMSRWYNFPEKMLLDPNAQQDGVRQNEKVVADLFEAYLGALLIDDELGTAKADTWLRQLMEPQVQSFVSNDETVIDVRAKQKLKNHLDAKYLTSGGYKIKYNWVGGGGGNAGGYDMQCVLILGNSTDEVEVGRGSGANKKAAEHRAAMAAVKKMRL